MAKVETPVITCVDTCCKCDNPGLLSSGDKNDNKGGCGGCGKHGHHKKH